VSRNPADFGDNGTALVARVVHPRRFYLSRAFDVGVVQADSLMMDKAATLAKLQQIRARQRSLIAGKSTLSVKTAWVNPQTFPPAAIAASAGIPCWMSSTFCYLSTALGAVN